jgi:hypothetical protein
VARQQVTGSPGLVGRLRNRLAALVPAAQMPGRSELRNLPEADAHNRHITSGHLLSEYQTFATYITSEFMTETSLGIHSRFPEPSGFPARNVEACIRDALDAEHDAQRVLRPQAQSACAPEVDSLVVVEVICAIEELLGVTLPTSFAPRGGYDDVEACVADLLEQTRRAWVELRKQEEEHHA